MTKKTTISIEQSAVCYQEIARKIKALEALQKPHKAALIDYAKAHPELIDESAQVKFKNGVYICVRAADKFKYSHESEQFLLDNLEQDYITTSLNEKAIISIAQKNKNFLKRLSASGASIELKEIYAVYAN